jgi:MFS family permease
MQSANRIDSNKPRGICPNIWFMESDNRTVDDQKAPRGRSRRSAAAASFHDSLRLLRTRRFGTFWFAGLLSNLGTWAQQVAEPWLLLSLGASSFLIGLDSFAAAAPVWILTLVGGMLADWADRRRLITLCQSLQMLCPAGITVLLLAGVIQPWMVILASLIVGITDALSMPSFQSIVPTIVERRQIATALALNATQFNLSRVLGPALAGILMASLGAVACFVLNAASYVPFIWVALWILPRGPARPSRDPPERAPLITGLREIGRSPHLRGALLTVLLTSVFCAPLTIFCPVLVKEVLGGDVGDFSLAMGAFGTGGLLGAVTLLGIDEKRDRRVLSSAFAGVYGLVVVLAALCGWFTALVLLLVVAGFSMTVSNTSANALLQGMAPSRLRGRSASVYMLAMRGGISIGSLMTGVSVNLLGVRHAMLINGALALASQAAVSREWFRLPLPKSLDAP